MDDSHKHHVKWKKTNTSRVHSVLFHLHKEQKKAKLSCADRSDDSGSPWKEGKLLKGGDLLGAENVLFGGAKWVFFIWGKWSSYMLMKFAFFIKNIFFKDASFLPSQTFVLHTFRSQDAFDLLQENLVHKRWGWTTHAQPWVLTVHIKHYDIVVRPHWEKRSKQGFVFAR